jgi:hypothetical protein
VDFKITRVTSIVSRSARRLSLPVLTVQSKLSDRRANFAVAGCGQPGCDGTRPVTAADTLWRPAQFVRGKLVVAEHAVALAVRESGLQSFRDFTVVYAKVDDTYEVRMLDLGRRDGEYVEVLGGLEAGTIYVTANSYLVKADIEKSGASHDH